MKRTPVHSLSWLHFLFFSFLLLLSHISSAQTVETFDVEGTLIGGNAIYCKGDIVRLELKFNCVCGFDYLLDEHYKKAGGCHFSCEITNRHEPRIQGPNIIWHSSPNEVPDCESTESSGTISCRIIANESATYSIAWSKKKVYDSQDPQCNFEGYTNIYNYFATTSIEVLDPDPSLTVADATVKVGERINLTVNDCMGGNWANFFIEEKCGNFNKTGICSNPSATIWAPSYPTTLMFKVRQRVISPSCWSDWSGFVKVEVEQASDPDACDDPHIRSIEEELANPETSGKRNYHHFPVISQIPEGCTKDEAWNTYTSSNTFAQPQSIDMPTDISHYLPAFRKFVQRPSSLKPPTQNCEEYSIYSSTNTIAKLAPYVFAAIGRPELLRELISLCPYFLVSNPLYDPIKIVVDNHNKCIIRYTLPGHTLYPGKTTTCLIEDQCGNASIRTIGEGTSICGEGLGGMAMAAINNWLGKKIFANNHERLNCN